MAGGRPRETSLEPEEMVALGHEMIQWLRANPDTLHLSEWYTIHKGYLYEEWKCFIRMPEFRPYYEQALKIVGLKYLTKNSDVRDGISQRWQRVYFKDLKEEEDETKEFESSLKVKEAKAGTEEERKRADDILNQLDKLQEGRSSNKPNNMDNA